MNKDQARTVAIDLLLETDTTSTRGQLLLIDKIATALANETTRAFQAGLKRGKAIAAETVAAETVADVQFTEVTENEDEDTESEPKIVSFKTASGETARFEL